MDISAVCEWTSENVRKWLRQKDLGRYEAVLCDKHAIDGPALLMLTERDVREAIVISGDKVMIGEMKRLLFAVRHLRATAKCGNRAHRMGASLCVLNARRRSRSRPSSASRRRPSNYAPPEENGEYSVPAQTDLSEGEELERKRDQREARQSPSRECEPATAFTDMEAKCQDSACRSRNCENSIVRRERGWSPEPEYTKALVSFVYVFSVVALTALAMVIVHERLPDMSKYPPLPDLLLDHLPETWWAFEACELCGAALFTIFSATVLFHKHRFIVLRRAFSLTGTIFLLRSVTMLVTSLSVPRVRSACRPMRHEGWSSRFEQAFAIWSAFGLRVRGLETCGDYMFSGHTSMLTILNHFVTEYTPRSYYRLHTLCWLLNLFGAFFILLSHEHYTLDVFVAFWLSSRLFLYYHTLANNAVSLRRDRYRTRVWFPLFNYFEARSGGPVPNEFELPLTRSSFCRAFLLLRRVAVQVVRFVHAVLAATQPRNAEPNLSDLDGSDAHLHAN